MPLLSVAALLTPPSLPPRGFDWSMGDKQEKEGRTMEYEMGLVLHFVTVGPVKKEEEH